MRSKASSQGEKKKANRGEMLKNLRSPVWSRKDVILPSPSRFYFLFSRKDFFRKQETLLK